MEESIIIHRTRRARSCRRGACGKRGLLLPGLASCSGVSHLAILTPLSSPTILPPPPQKVTTNIYRRSLRPALLLSTSRLVSHLILKNSAGRQTLFLSPFPRLLRSICENGNNTGSLMRLLGGHSKIIYEMHRAQTQCWEGEYSKSLHGQP